MKTATAIKPAKVTFLRTINKLLSRDFVIEGSTSNSESHLVSYFQIKLG